METVQVGNKAVRGCIACNACSQNGKVDAQKLQPITNDSMNHHYLVLGKKVGQAFHDGLTLK